MRRNKGFTLIELMIVIAIIAVIAAIAIPGLLQAQRASNERNASTSLKTISSAQADLRANDRDGNKVNDFWTLDVAGLYTLYNWIDLNAAQQQPIALVELSIAAADAAPADGAGAAAVGGGPATYNSPNLFSNYSAKAGYWYNMLVTDPSGVAVLTYQTDTTGVDNAGNTYAASAYHTSKFACMAFPDSLSAGKAAFIVNESNTVYKQQLSNECRVPGGVPPGYPLQPGGLLPAGSETAWPTSTILKANWQKLD